MSGIGSGRSDGLPLPVRDYRRWLSMIGGHSSRRKRYVATLPPKMRMSPHFKEKEATMLIFAAMMIRPPRADRCRREQILGHGG